MRHLSPTKTTSIGTYFSLITDIATGLAGFAALGAYFLQINTIFSTIIFLLAILILSVSVFLRSFIQNRDTDKFYSFLKNELLPNQSKQALGLKTDVVVIEHDENFSIYSKFRKEFKNLEEIKFTHFVPDSSDVYRQRSRLLDSLSGAESVILVRTKNLERVPWVYECVQEWALKNSHAPCLVIDKIDPNELDQLNTHSIPENFFFISDDSKSLPWSLLKRANQRTAAWRTLAKLNRSMSRRIWMLLFIAIAGLTVTYYLNYQERKESFNGLKEIYKGVARQTERQYESQFPGTDVTLSHWIRSGSKMYQVGSSGDRPVQDYWRLGVSKDRVVGCVLSHRNHIVKATKGAGIMEMTTIEGDPVGLDLECKFMPQGSREVKAILCISNNQTDDDENTVGICIDTPNDSDIFSADSINFMKERVKEFHAGLSPVKKRGYILAN